ncbi:MAG: hypothetical protein RI949_1060 [Pseudomonadota bacterium]|jgi:hypothetical protein
MKHSLSRPIVAAAPCVVALLSGCASVMNETTQPMKIETRNADGSYVVGVECRISNDFGVLTSHSGDTAMVRRSSMDLDIVCKHPNSSADNATARAISRANAGLAANFLNAGVGIIVDHKKGTAYTYPTWVRLTFGKTLVFDRAQEKEGRPVEGTEPGK